MHKFVSISRTDLDRNTKPNSRGHATVLSITGIQWGDHVASKSGQHHCQSFRSLVSWYDSKFGIHGHVIRTSTSDLYCSVRDLCPNRHLKDPRSKPSDQMMTNRSWNAISKSSLNLLDILPYEECLAVIRTMKNSRNIFTTSLCVLLRWRVSYHSCVAV